MKTIAIISNKGGTGKTATAGAMLAGLTLKGFKALAVDLDAQSNLTYITGANNKGACMLELLTGETKASDLIQKTDSGDIIPASRDLAGANITITGAGKETRLKRALADVSGLYDFIILDTAPVLDIVTINVLMCTDYIVIPCKADVLSLQGLEFTQENIEAVKEHGNPNLKIAGILLTCYNDRSTINKGAKGLIEQMAGKMGTKVFETHIREAVAIREAQILQENPFKYAPKAKPMQDYIKFIEELLREIGA